MPYLPPFDQAGPWFKGNLHTHTSESDGKLSPAENILWHAANGYDFLALTDHNVYTPGREFLADPPLALIPSVELTARRGIVEYHVVSLGVEGLPIAPHGDVQETIEAVNRAGGVCFIAHPYWHDHSFEDLLFLNGYLGIEIFNTGCFLEINKGHALVHLDGLLRRGRRVWGFAVDDSHFFYPDYGRGWIMIRSEGLDSPALLEALRRGNFYSSMGPEIRGIRAEGRTVTVNCSPARSIYLIGDLWHCPDARHSWEGEPLTEAAFALHQGQRYLRVEVVDNEGRSAWSNAYFLP